jgi:hypothetical protein
MWSISQKNVPPAADRGRSGVTMSVIVKRSEKAAKVRERSAKMICDQVEKEFKARKTEVTLSANTINRYVSEGKKEKV